MGISMEKCRKLEERMRTPAAVSTQNTVIANILPELLKAVLRLTRTQPSTDLTNYAPIKRGGKGFKVGYVALEGRIYECAIDEKADVMDPEGGSMRRVAMQGFLHWIRQDGKRAREVYQNILDYLETVRQYAPPDPEQLREASMRFF